MKKSERMISGMPLARCGKNEGQSCLVSKVANCAYMDGLSIISTL